jgi:hypothetical protein
MDKTGLIFGKDKGLIPYSEEKEGIPQAATVLGRHLPQRVVSLGSGLIIATR